MKDLKGMKGYKEVKGYAIDRLENMKGYDCVEGSELHNEIFNTDYYIIGTYQAKEWLGSDVFEAIDIIKEYEQDNFGEVTTDLSEPEKVVNIYVYILGELILQESKSLSDNWDTCLNDESLQDIINDLS